MAYNSFCVVQTNPMKNIFILLVAATTIFTSCSRQTYPDSTPYPSPTPRNDPNEPVIVDQQGRVITRDGRIIGNAGNMPPGQAKKVYGSKSAKVYAPGQRKKAAGNYGQLPPGVITIPDRYAQRDARGRYYYIDENGYRYRRGNDGRYYLDESENNNSRYGKNDNGDEREKYKSNRIKGNQKHKKNNSTY